MLKRCSWTIVNERSSLLSFRLPRVAAEVVGLCGQLVNNLPEAVKSRPKGVMGTLMAVVVLGEESR